MYAGSAFESLSLPPRDANNGRGMLGRFPTVFPEFREVECCSVCPELVCDGTGLMKSSDIVV